MSTFTKTILGILVVPADFLLKYALGLLVASPCLLFFDHRVTLVIGSIIAVMLCGFFEGCKGFCLYRMDCFEDDESGNGS